MSLPAWLEVDRWIEVVLTEAAESAASGGGPFGAVVVGPEGLLGSGANRVTAELDPTAHAEVVAVRDACRRRGDFRLTDSVLIASAEPCPMCLGAVLWARLAGVVFAADRHDAAAAGFDDLAFFELFGRARESWPITVRQHEHPRRLAPFDAWAANPDRVAY